MMLKTNTTADLATFHALLEVYAEKGDANTCLNLYRAMEDTGLAKPDAM